MEFDIPPSFYLNSIVEYDECCSFLDPIEFMNPKPGCRCKHCAHTKLFIEIILEKMIFDSMENVRCDREEVLRLFMLFGFDKKFLFKIRETSQIVDILTFFVIQSSIKIHRSNVHNRRPFVQAFLNILNIILADYAVIDNILRKRINKLVHEFSDLDDCYLPESPLTLQHACRCEIRTSLRTCKSLPFGVLKLDIPRVLQEYINLDVDVKLLDKTINDGYWIKGHERSKF